MSLGKRLGMRIAERKKPEHLIRCNERHTQPRAQMGKPPESDPFCLYRRVRDQQAVPADENVHQKLTLLCIKGCWGFRDATIGFASLHLAGKEQPRVGFR